MFQEMLQLAKSNSPGWVDYKWKDQVAQKVRLKRAYVVHAPDSEIYFAAGYYMN